MSLKTPRERRHDRSRQHILTAARELVLEVGVEGLSLRKVAERADFSPASLYEYFDGKDAIVRELSGAVMARLDARLAQVGTALPPGRRLVRLGLAYVSFARELPEDFVLLFWTLRSRRGSTGEPPGPGSPFARLLDAARAGLADGSFAEKEGRGPDEIAYGVWAAAHGLAMLQLTHLKDFQADFETADRLALEALVAGLAKGG